MLPVKHIYIDSKFKTKDSVSSTHFKYDLPESFLMNDNTGYYVCDVAIPHSWYTIEPGINDKFSIPPKLFFRHHLTQSFQFSPEFILTSV